MFKTLVPYNQGQELALKYLWIVLQVTSNVAHDVFLILYSHLDNTDGGEKSILQYCEENNKMFVYMELLEDGYAEKLFKGSPKNAKHFDLKMTRMLTESLIVNRFEGGSMLKVSRIMKDFNYLRNDLCHLELQSLRDKDFKNKLQEHWETLKMLYKSVCELTGRTFSSHITKDLDSTMSSLMSSVDTKDSKCRNCTGRDNIRKGSRTRGTSQSSVDSGYFEPNQPTKHSAKEASGSPKYTNTKRIMKEKWVQTLPPRKLTMKNAYTQVEINKDIGLKVKEKDISWTVRVPPKNETVGTVTQAEPSKDIHKNMSFTLSFKDLNKPSTSGGKEASADHSHKYRGELPCCAEDSLKTRSNNSEGREECFRRERMNFPHHSINSKDTSTTPASGTGKRSNCASFKHSDMDINRSNKCAFSEHGKDAEPKEATTSDQHKCTCKDGRASRKDATNVRETSTNILQMIFMCIVSFLCFCFNVLAVCTFDLVDKVKRECHLRRFKNSIRIIINAKTGLGQVAHVVHVEGNYLVLLYPHPPVCVIPRMPHDHHHHHHPPNFPRPNRFGRRRS